MSEALCPCCGEPQAGRIDPRRLGEFIALPRSERRIYDALASRFGRTVTADQLADALYFDDPDGGPELTYNTISVLVHTLRVRIQPFGLAITGYTGRGNSGRKLHWIGT